MKSPLTRCKSARPKSRKSSPGTRPGRPAWRTDGPYAEAHDVLGGIFTVKAESDAMAEELAQSCPHLVGAQWIEIRRIESI